MSLGEDQCFREASEVPWGFTIGTSLASFKHWISPRDRMGLYVYPSWQGYVYSTHTYTLDWPTTAATGYLHACTYMSDMPRVGLNGTHTLGSTLLLEYLQKIRELFCTFSQNSER